MINNKSVIAIVPARAGSKGLPGKNIKLLNSKPLINWTIEQALDSSFIDNVVVSTDCPRIYMIATRAGATVPFLRPKSLATDNSSTYDVIGHCIKFYSLLNINYDYIVLMEPTSPLRKKNDIDNMIKKLDSHSDQFDSIVSLGLADHHPGILKTLNKEKVANYLQSSVSNLQRQAYPPVYFPFGVGYIAKTQAYLEQKTFYTSSCMGYTIERFQNYEIDDICDFICVEYMLNQYLD